jgi:Uma2 family endonuclease
MTALKRPHFISVEDYLAGEELSEIRHEYLGGVVHAMAGGTNDHAAIAMNAGISLGGQLRGKPCRPFGSDAKVRIELQHQTRFYYPDLQVVCMPNPGSDRFHERPVVIMEVLSESTRRTDMGEKKDTYLSIPSLRVLILAETDASRVTVYRRRAEGGFDAEEYSGLGEVILLPEIGAELPLAEIYDGISFA